jgi:hypothetical protein
VRVAQVLRAAALVVTGVAAAATLTACGGGGSTNGASPISSVSGATGFEAYLSCLGQHGVTLPSRTPRSPGVRPSFSRGPRPSGSAGTGRGGFGGGFGGGLGGLFGDANNPPAGVSASTWSVALSACKSLQPTAGSRGGFTNSQFTAYRNCLQSHGVTFSAGPDGLSTSDPKIAAALKTCAPLRPVPSNRPSAAPTPAPSATG